jgi:hypothetical protein
LVIIAFLCCVVTQMHLIRVAMIVVAG